MRFFTKKTNTEDFVKTTDDKVNSFDELDGSSGKDEQRRVIKAEKKPKSKKKEGFLVRFYRIFDIKALVTGFVFVFGGILLNACNLDTKTGGYFGLAAFSYACFILGVLLWFVLLVAEEMSKGRVSAYFTLSSVSFALAVISIHTFFTLFGIVDLSGGQILLILAAAVVFFAAGLAFHVISKSKKDSISPLRVIKDDTGFIKEIFAHTSYNSTYRYNNRVIQVTRSRRIQKYQENTKKKSAPISSDLEPFYSWVTICLFTFLWPLFIVSTPILIYRMLTNADRDKKKAMKKLISYTAVSFVVSLIMAIGLFSIEFAVSSLIVFIILSPAVQTITGLYFIAFYPKSRKKKIKKDELCKNLILTDKITDINTIAERTGITYSKALKTIDGMIYDNQIRDAFIDHSGEEVIVKGITDKVAFKCNNCGGTSVIKMNEKQKCKWCGADYI